MRWATEISQDEIATTVVTITEIQRGIERVRSQHPAAAKEAEDWLGGMLVVGEPQVLPMNVEAARLLGRMYENPSLRHFIITDPKAMDQATGADLAIATIAITVGATVATNSVEHFLQFHAVFPLPWLLDPANQIWYVEPGRK